MTQTTSPSLLITGATGNIGFELAKQLSAKGVAFRALVRSKEKAGELALLPGVELVTADLADPESLATALKGIRRAFLLTNSSEQAETLQNGFADAARSAGVQHIVKLSQLAAAADSPVRFLRYHAAVEQHIKAAGMAYTFLRPNLFMQGLLGFSSTISSKGMFFAAIGDARISLVDIRDIATVAVAALTAEGHESKVYTITGPEALTHAELAAQFSAILGREIRFVQVSPEDMRKSLIDVGFPLWQADGLIEDYAHYARGEAAAVSADVQTVTGQAPRNFNTFVKDYARAFS
ncbi:SDR family oxidoreductase [uncultured Chitinophaga sp.]|jgi:Predicted nucleoside-diphosphate-sugar epimerases|uniref:SDR family oxidoreductase n=1 Tax=uncultured Chitinophaga sp. TaxID=339340 RepID=UPI00260507CF|nr:SDR family oxidoreductase [uncultured Chitinophaga sp.]